jgi:serine/threonine protein kinase
MCCGLDFGLSKQNIDMTGGATTFCGTAEYIAPEVFWELCPFQNNRKAYCIVNVHVSSFSKGRNTVRQWTGGALEFFYMR